MCIGRIQNHEKQDSSTKLLSMMFNDIGMQLLYKSKLDSQRIPDHLSCHHWLKRGLPVHNDHNLFVCGVDGNIISNIPCTSVLLPFIMFMKFLPILKVHRYKSFPNLLRELITMYQGGGSMTWTLIVPVGIFTIPLGNTRLMVTIGLSWNDPTLPEPTGINFDQHVRGK